jgi:hypothetical protein
MKKATEIISCFKLLEADVSARTSSMLPLVSHTLCSTFVGVSASLDSAAALV